jgi:hypothetical protein
MRTVTATRYVTPLREGGSLPAIVEADDDGLYVLKFRGAGQGPRALVAEWIAGELARAAGLRIPEQVGVEVSPALGRNEPDGEIRALLKESVGLNLGVDWLPGSVTFDPAADRAPAPDEASGIVWFDAFVTNVDRTPKNPNLLEWHRQLWLIDHGAALWFHHAWDRAAGAAESPFPAVKDHVLLPWAAAVAAAAERLAPRVRAALPQVLAEVPDAWLEGEPRFASPAEHRAAYAELLGRRLDASPIFVAEAERARTAIV